MAEIKDILETNEFRLELSSANNLPNQPSRIELDAVLVENGYSLPLQRSATFFVSSANGKLFNVTRFEPIGIYAYEKLTVV